LVITAGHGEQSLSIFLIGIVKSIQRKPFPFPDPNRFIPLA